MAKPTIYLPKRCWSVATKTIKPAPCHQKLRSHSLSFCPYCDFQVACLKQNTHVNETTNQSGHINAAAISLVNSITWVFVLADNYPEKDSIATFQCCYCSTISISVSNCFRKYRFFICSKFPPFSIAGSMFRFRNSSARQCYHQTFP